MTFPRVPSNIPDNVGGYLRQMVSYLAQEFARRPVPDTAVGSVLLVSPNRSVYSVQVKDDGTLQTTLVQSS